MKQSDYRAWFVTVSAFILALIIVVTNREWNPYNTVIVGGGLGLGPLLLTALKVWKGDDGTRTERETRRDNPAPESYPPKFSVEDDSLDSNPDSKRVAFSFLLNSLGI